MQNDSSFPLRFSQRNGYADIPPQMKLGDISNDVRRFIDYAISSEIDRVKVSGYNSSYFTGKWETVARDLHVFFFGGVIERFDNSSYLLKNTLSAYVQRSQFALVFDLIEFLAGHSGTSELLSKELAMAFQRARSPYRLVDSQVVAVGTEGQAEAYLQAIDVTQLHGAEGAKGHLLKGGVALRSGDWSSAVRESIHAVESAAKLILPEAKTLGDALKEIRKKHYMHGGLSDAFLKLYGYTNDEKGIRHADVFGTANVDETDALFMLGACSSFITYLLARQAQPIRTDNRTL